jgi:hypothetical protein
MYRHPYPCITHPRAETKIRTMPGLEIDRTIGGSKAHSIVKTLSPDDTPLSFELRQ